MIKGLLVYINIVFLSLVGFFSEEPVTVDAQVPSSAKSGEAFDIVVNIKKGAITEFAKFQFQLPVGFTAENIDSKTGAFSFADQQVKIIWMALPTEPEFQIKFKVKTFSSINGTYNLSGKFHYVLQGTKYEASTSPKSITVGTPALATNNTTTKETTTTTAQSTTQTKKEEPTQTIAQQTTQETAKKEEPVTTTKPADETKTVAQQTTTAANTNTTTKSESIASTTTDGIELKRTLSATQVLKSGSFTVDLVINKGDASGFAKIMESLPIGFVAEEIDAFGGIFSFQDNKVKILWMTMPASKEIKVKYKVTAVAALNGKFIIEGFFSYLKESDGANKKIAFSNSQFAVVDQITEEPVIAANTTKTEEPKTVATETKQTAKTTEATKETTTASVKVIEKGGDEVKVEKKLSTSDKKISTDNTTASTTTKDFGVSNPNQNLYYSVQICATKKQVDVSYFVKANNINEKIYTLMHEGWHKYIVGEFAVYKDARDHREEVKTQNKVVGPFVTAYNKGVRITVQEALMISGQKWIQ